MVDFEIYVGQYDKEKMLEKPVFKFEKEKLTVIRPYVGTTVTPENKGDQISIDSDTVIDDRIVIIATDEKNTFWPCIIRLTNGEAKQLISVLEKAIKHKGFTREEDPQFYESIEP